MRKVKLTVIFILSITIVFGVSCGKKEQKTEVENVKNEQREEKSKDNATVTKKEEVKTPADNTSESETEETLILNTPGSINLYYSNENADGYQQEKIDVEQVTPEIVMKLLKDKSVIPMDVELINSEKKIVDGKEVIDIDFSAAFDIYIQTMGTAGEQITIGSICNTFLSTYNCEKIKLTVEGESIQTGHAEYPGYMSVFK